MVESYHLETRASPLHDVGRTLPSQRAGAKSPTRVITLFCKLIQNTIFLMNYLTCCVSPLAVLLELFHDRVSSKGLEEAPGRTRLSWRSKLQLPQSGECCICIHFAIKIRLWCLVRIERYPFCFVFGPKRSWCPPYTQRQKPEGKLFYFFRIFT